MIDRIAELLQHGIDAALLNQGAALLVGSIVTYCVLGNTTRLRSLQNLRVLLLLLPAVFLIDIVKWEYRSDTPWAATGLLFAFRGLQGALLLVTAVSLAASLRQREDTPSNLPTSALRVLAFLLVITNVIITVGRDPDDCGIYSNLGAQRWHETGQLPYGDESLKGPKSPGHGAAATYGPLLYLAHIPTQIIIGPSNNPPSLPVAAKDTYVLPAPMATKITALLFHFVGLFALYSIGRRCRGTATRWALVVAYAGCPYVLGLGGEANWLSSADAFACGLSYISHIAPASLVLLALAFARRPAISGGILAAATGVLYFPAFLLPAFFGWQWQRGAATRFIIGFALVGLLTTGLVLHGTAGETLTDRASAFVHSTFDHQEGAAKGEYGQSKYSFWGQHEQLSAYWKSPILDSHRILSPSFLALVGLTLLTLFLARSRCLSLGQLAFLLAAVAAAVQLWKTHAAGTYVEWYYPLLLIGFLCPNIMDDDA